MEKSTTEHRATHEALGVVLQEAVALARVGPEALQRRVDLVLDLGRRHPGQRLQLIALVPGSSCVDARLGKAGFGLREPPLHRSWHHADPGRFANRPYMYVYLNRYWRYMLALSSTSASVTWVRPLDATLSSMRLRIRWLMA